MLYYRFRLSTSLVCSLFLILCLSFVRARTNQKKKTHKNLRKEEKKYHSTAIFDLTKSTEFLLHLLPTSQDLSVFSLESAIPRCYPSLYLRLVSISLFASIFFSLIFDLCDCMRLDCDGLDDFELCSEFDWDSSGSGGLNCVC